MSFIFGGNTGESYEDIQRKRKIAEALALQMGGSQNVGQGLSAIGRALVVRSMNKKADEADKANRDTFAEKWGSLFGGGGSTPPFVASGGSSYTPPDPNSPEGIAGDTMTALGKSPDQVIKAGLMQRGLPEHVADGFIMNFKSESGLDPAINEKSPLVPGSRGGYGLAQWTGPRRVALENFAASSGRSVSDPNVQLDFLMTELQGPEAKAAQSIMDATDAATAAQAIAKNFLRPAPDNLARRVAEYGGATPSVAQAGGGMDLKTLAEIAASPYATAGQRTMAEALLKQQMQAMDPAYALDLQLKRKQVEAFGKPEPVNAEYNLAVQQAILRGEPAPTLTEWKRGNASAGAANTTVTVGGEESVPANDAALRKKLGEKEGEVWSSYLEAGSVSAGTIQDMQFIDELIGMAPQGPISGRLANAFPGFNSAADAFNSVVKRVAPTLRAPGSGSTSDIEYDGMLKSLPQLAAKPEANRAIAAMMKAKAEINVKRAEIVRAAQNDEIGVKEARRMMSELDQQSIMTPELQSILGELAPQPEPSGTENGIQWRIVE